MNLRNLKVGDTVFVVWKRRRNSKEPPRTSTEVIERVGRKYAYLVTPYRTSYVFCRDTGKSHDPKDDNAYCNGCGFDVYRCETYYVKEQHEATEFTRLSDRLIGRYNLNPLSPEVVEKIHDVLDNAGVDRNHEHPSHPRAMNLLCRCGNGRNYYGGSDGQSRRQTQGNSRCLR